MDDIQKMLRTIINGQSTFRQEVLGKIDSLDKKLTSRIDEMDTRLTGEIKGVNIRLDKIGKQLAYLEDDAPTREELDELVKKVENINPTVAPV